MELNVTSNKAAGGKVVTTFEVDVPENLDGMTEAWGAEAVYELALAQLKIDAQARARTRLDKGATVEQVQEEMMSWKPGVKLPRAGGGTGGLTKLVSNFQKADDAGKSAYLDQIRKLLADKGIQI